MGGRQLLFIVLAFLVISFSFSVKDAEECRALKDPETRTECYMSVVDYIADKDMDEGENICERVFNDAFQHERYKNCILTFVSKMAHLDPNKALTLCDIKMEENNEKDVCFKSVAAKIALTFAEVGEKTCTRVLNTELRIKCYREVANTIASVNSRKAISLCLSYMPDKDSEQECFGEVVAGISGNNTETALLFCNETYDTDLERSECFENVVYSIAGTKVTKAVHLCESFFVGDNEKKSWCYFNVAQIVGKTNFATSLIICKEIADFSEKKNFDCRNAIITRIAAKDPGKALLACRQDTNRIEKNRCLSELKKKKTLPGIYIGVYYVFYYYEFILGAVLISLFLVLIIIGKSFFRQLKEGE